MNLRPRSLLPTICQHLDDPQAILLLGSRRSGKTSLLRLILGELKKRDTPESQIVFFDLENQLIADELNAIEDYDLIPLFLQSRGADIKRRVFVFLDEVQYLNNASGFIKYSVDHHPNLKFIVSGSASLSVKKVFSDSMVGRVYNFPVRPLNFLEFLDFKGEAQLVKVLKESPLRFDGLSDVSVNRWEKTFRFYGKELSRLFARFCCFGGYPEVVLSKTDEEKKKILGRLYSEYVRKDIQHLREIRQVAAYNNLVRLLAGQSGQLVNDSELAISLKITRPTVNRFVFLLNETFIIKMISPYSKNPRQEIIKTPKVYFEDTGIVNLLNDNFQELSRHSSKGNLVENTVFAQLIKSGVDPAFHLHFWRTKPGAEVDFIIQTGDGGLVPIEVKYRRFAGPKIPTGLRAFVNRYSPEYALVATRDFFGERKIGKTRIVFIPVWMM